MKKVTNDGKRGGTLKGKPHYDKQGKDAGGIKAVVTDAGNKPVELEGGEVIINKAASKKHWKLLSKINQSAGNGVPIHKPSEADDEDPSEEYERGGNIDFNVNNVPNKWIINYAKKIKANHPEVWKLGGNIFGNEAFKNLSRVSERGYWLDSEEWMYKKWQSFLARHQHDFRIAGVIAVLKWGGKVNKGWAYMKDLIEAEIKKRSSKPKSMKDGGNVVTYKNKFNRKYGFDSDESHSLAEISKLTKLKLSALQDIYDKGIGAYKTNPQSVRPNVKSKEQWAMARVYSAVMGGKAAKVDANELKRGKKYADGGSVKNDCIEFIKKSESLLNNGYILHIKNLSVYVGDGDKTIPKIKSLILITYNSGGQSNLKASDTINSSSLSQEIAKLIGGNIYIARIIVSEQMIHSKRISLNVLKGVENENIIIADRDRIVCTNLTANYEDGGELAKGIKAEMEHKDTIDKFKKSGVSDKQVAESIAKDHLKEDPKYYTKLMKMESKKADGGLVYNTKYAMWETNVADSLSDMLDISYNDAQGIIEANDYYVKEAYRKGWASDFTAQQLSEKSTIFKEGGNLEAKVKSKLSKSFALPFELAVYVPSTKGADETISDAEFRERVKEVQIYLSNLFGGFSKSDIDGGYMSSEKGLITENVAKVTAFGQQEGFEEKLPNLIDKISDWCEMWTQESMGFEFEGDLFYVEKGFKYADGGNIGKREKVRRVMTEYKQGTLHIGKSGKIVKDKQQAIAIALSEAGLSKKADGGSIQINRETNRGEYIKRLLDNVTTLPKANPYITSRTEQPLFKSVDFTKPTRNDESRAFINTSIYTSEMDYVIGGFPHEKLNNIVVVGNTNPFSMAKLEIILHDRVVNLIENFKTEIATNIARTEEDFDSITMENDTRDELDNLFETYIGQNVFTTNTHELAEIIMQHESLKTWMGRIQQRVMEYQSMLTYRGSVNDTSDLKMDILDVEEMTFDATLEQLLEKLSIITEQNEL
jgi:hypothetical protein